MTRNPVPVLTASIVGLGLAAEAALYCSLVAARNAMHRANALRSASKRWM